MSRASAKRALVVIALLAVAVGATAAVRLPSSPTRLHLAPGLGRAAQGGQPAVSKPRASVAVRGKLPRSRVLSRPTALYLNKAHSAVFDVRRLKSRVVKRERPERPAPGAPEGGIAEESSTATLPTRVAPSTVTRADAPAPAPDSSFDGLDFANWGAGHPPDTNGDVGPTYYIQTINTSIGIYDKSTGARVAAFTFDSFMSQGNFGNFCDTDNFGDPVVLYDSFENRWFVSDFAFKLDGSGNVSPQHVFECFAVSKTADPVAGGWNFYSIETPGGLGDYPKFGVWPDGIYMSANMFGYGATDSYIEPHVWAIDKAQMYAGAPTVQVVDFAGPSDDFTLLPANSRLQAGTPPTGSPEYFVSTAEWLNAINIYKFHVDWDKISTSTFTGPELQTAPTCWPNASVGTIPTPANSLDSLEIRAMAQAQYSKIGANESVWVSHTVRRPEIASGSCGASASGSAAVRWYQANVTGGTVAANVVQGKTWDPDGTNTLFRWMPSLAVDRNGDMAVGYSLANATTNPKIMYAGRLASDPVNTFGQGEQTLIAGTGSQSGNCGGSACERWGDYSGMALDPNGCTFWETNEYYAVNGLDHHTRIGSFHYPSCTTVGNGTVSGTVTDGTNPISGASVALGSRTTTTDGAGHYSLVVPAGTYPSLSVSKAGFDSASQASVSVPNGGTATRNFTLAAAAQTGCFTDNTQTAFQRGVPANCDLTASPGSVVLANPANIDQENSDIGASGFGFSNTSWAGQTFTPSVTGKLTRAQVELFCSNCSGANPDITVSLRATSGGVPTGSDLAGATLTGFNDGAAGGLKTVTFSSPATVTAGTRYALIFRAVAARTGGTYAYTCSCSPNSNPYANGQLVTSTNSGSTWSADAPGRDLNFKTYVNSGYAPSGSFVSSLKDANPAAGRTPSWTTLSFTATKPAGTDVKFQVAASNSSYGPFNFVGPDGTAGTYFTTSGASLSQFNGLRYLRYKAILSTTNSSITPALSSVGVCFDDVGGALATGLAVSPASGTYGGATTLSATLTAGATGVSGKSIAFTLNGNSVGSAPTNGSGVATLGGVSLAGVNAGSYPSGIGASFAGDGSYNASSGSGALTVAKANQTINVTGHAPASATYGSTFFVAASATSGLAVSYSSSGSCSNAGTAFTITSGTGTCTVKYDQPGNDNYNAAPQATESVTAQKANQTITVITHAPSTATFNTSFDVAASTGNGLPITYSSTGGCTNTNAHFTMTSGTVACTVKYDQAGNGNYNPAPPVTESVTAQKANQTITVSVHAPAEAVVATAFDVAATAAPGLTVMYSSAGVCTNTDAHFTMTSGTGTCTVKYDQPGNDNYNAAPQLTESVAAKNMSQAITVTTHAPATADYGSSFTVAATGGGATSPVTFSSSGSCSNVGATFTITGGTGTCTVKYDQAGDDDHAAAPQVTESVAAQKALLTVGPSPAASARQYSDPNPAVAAGISGFVNGENASVLSVQPTCASPAGGASAPGSYGVGCSGGAAANYAFAYVGGTLTVGQEDARSAYDGKSRFVTPSPSNPNASVALSATVRDITAVVTDPAFDPFAGDVRTANVTFVNRATGNAFPGCANLPIGLVVPADATVGRAACTTTLNASTKKGGTQYTVGIVVGGFYARNDTSENHVVTVVRHAAKKPPRKVVLCYHHRTVKVTKAVAKKLRKRGAKPGACKKRR